MRQEIYGAIVYSEIPLGRDSFSRGDQSVGKH